MAGWFIPDDKNLTLADHLRYEGAARLVEHHLSDGTAGLSRARLEQRAVTEHLPRGESLGRSPTLSDDVSVGAFGHLLPAR